MWSIQELLFDLLFDLGQSLLKFSQESKKGFALPLGLFNRARCQNINHKWRKDVRRDERTMNGGSPVVQLVFQASQSRRERLFTAVWRLLGGKRNRAAERLYFRVWSFCLNYRACWGFFGIRNRRAIIDQSIMFRLIEHLFCRTSFSQTRRVYQCFLCRNRFFGAKI